MTKQKKPLVLQPERVKQLTKQELDKVTGGYTNIPKQPDPGGVTQNN